MGYGFARVGHFFLERNKAATFGYPSLSFVSDFRLVFCSLTGRMPAEVERARAGTSH